MALTLAEYAKAESRDPKRAYILKNMIRHSPMFDVIPWEKAKAFRVSGLRWRNLPDVDWRSINEGYTASEGSIEEVWETLYGFGGDINYDRVFELTTATLVDPIRVQIDMKMASMGFKFNDYLINGDPAVNAKGLMGLKARVTNAPSRQKVGFAGGSATGLDATASTANAQAFFNNLGKIHKRTNGGEHQAWFCNENVQLGIGVAARYLNISGGGFLDVTKDSLNREFPTMYGSPIYDIGLKKDQSTEIITNTETAGDSGSDSTSIYCVAFNSEQGLMGAQLEPLKFYDPLNGGEQESTPAKLRRIDWWIAFVAFGSYGITRGWNLHDPSAWTVPA